MRTHLFLCSLTTFVCLRKFLKQDKLYRVWTWTNSTLLDVIFLYVVLGLDLMFYKVSVISIYFCWQH